MRKMPMVGRDYPTIKQMLGCYNIGSLMKAGDEPSTFGSKVRRLLFGGALFWIPGFGPILVTGWPAEGQDWRGKVAVSGRSKIIRSIAFTVLFLPMIVSAEF